MVASAALDPASVCAVVLAGGRAARMGGLDKGLQPVQGRPLVAHALERLRLQQGGAPGQIGISANRHLAEYQGFGVPVWPDATPEFAGPLAGFMAALQACRADFTYLLTVPCDSPQFPLDLLQRLGHALRQQDAEVALAMGADASEAPGGKLYPQPVFCLLHTRLADSVQAFLEGGERKIGAWAARHRLCRVAFDAPHDVHGAFANLNTLEELRLLEHP